MVVSNILAIAARNPIWRIGTICMMTLPARPIGTYTILEWVTPIIEKKVATSAAGAYSPVENMGMILVNVFFYTA